MATRITTEYESAGVTSGDLGRGVHGGEELASTQTGQVIVVDCEGFFVAPGGVGNARSHGSLAPRHPLKFGPRDSI